MECNIGKPLDKMDNILLKEVSVTPLRLWTNCDPQKPLFISLPTALRIIFRFYLSELYLEHLKFHPNLFTQHYCPPSSHISYVSTLPHFLHFSTCAKVNISSLSKTRGFQKYLLNSTFSKNFSKIPPLKISHPVQCFHYTYILFCTDFSVLVHMCPHPYP